MRRVCAALVAAAAAVWGGSFGPLPSAERAQQPNTSGAGRCAHAFLLGAAATERSQRAIDAAQHVSRELRRVVVRVRARAAHPSYDRLDLGAAPLRALSVGRCAFPSARPQPEGAGDGAARHAGAGEPQVELVELVELVEQLFDGAGHGRRGRRRSRGLRAPRPTAASAPCHYKDKSPSGCRRRLSGPPPRRNYAKPLERVRQRHETQETIDRSRVRTRNRRLGGRIDFEPDRRRTPTRVPVVLPPRGRRRR